MASASFEHAEQLLEGMTTLSPRHLERLSRKCTHVKVRRLIYWLADQVGPVKQRHSAKRIFERLRDEHGFGRGKDRDINIRFLALAIHQVYEPTPTSRPTNAVRTSAPSGSFTRFETLSKRMVALVSLS